MVETPGHEREPKAPPEWRTARAVTAWAPPPQAQPISGLTVRKRTKRPPNALVSLSRRHHGRPLRPSLPLADEGVSAH